jgi:hypothetical protein
MSAGFELYENTNTNTNINANTISSAFNIKNKYLNSSIFLNKKEDNSLLEPIETDVANTNVTFYGNAVGHNAIELQSLKENIEKMSKFHQIEILRILSSSNKVYLNENNNGTFVNLTEQSDDIIEELKKYVKYVSEQQLHLSIIENEKSRLEKIFCKDNKEK